MGRALPAGRGRESDLRSREGGQPGLVSPAGTLVASRLVEVEVERPSMSIIAMVWAADGWLETEVRVESRNCRRSLAVRAKGFTFFTLKVRPRGFDIINTGGAKCSLKRLCPPNMLSILLAIFSNIYDVG